MTTTLFPGTQERSGIHIYEAHPAKAGYLRLVAMLTTREACAIFEPALVKAGIEFEYISNGGEFLANGTRNRERPIPSDYRAIACYAVTGGNEGHRAYVDAILPDGTAFNILSVKTFGGMETAQKIAALAADIFEA